MISFGERRLRFYLLIELKDLGLYFMYFREKWLRIRFFFWVLLMRENWLRNFCNVMFRVLFLKLEYFKYFLVISELKLFLL